MSGSASFMARTKSHVPGVRSTGVAHRQSGARWRDSAVCAVAEAHRLSVLGGGTYPALRGTGLVDDRGPLRRRLGQVETYAVK